MSQIPMSSSNHNLHSTPHHATPQHAVSTTPAVLSPSIYVAFTLSLTSLPILIQSIMISARHIYSVEHETFRQLQVLRYCRYIATSHMLCCSVTDKWHAKCCLIISILESVYCRQVQRFCHVAYDLQIPQMTDKQMNRQKTSHSHKSAAFVSKV